VYVANSTDLVFLSDPDDKHAPHSAYVPVGPGQHAVHESIRLHSQPH
jgi:hypothetical protein